MKNATFAFLFAVLVALGAVAPAQAAPFFGATLGAAQINFTDCRGKCGLLDQKTMEPVFGFRGGYWWKYFGVMAEFQQTVNMHAKRRGEVDDRYVSASLLARLPTNYSWYPYAGVSSGGQFTGTPLGDCNHRADRALIGISQNQIRNRWSLFAEATSSRTHHEFGDDPVLVRVRQSTTTIIAGATYTF